MTLSVSIIIIIHHTVIHHIYHSSLCYFLPHLHDSTKRVPKRRIWTSCSIPWEGRCDDEINQTRPSSQMVVWNAQPFFCNQIRPATGRHMVVWYETIWHAQSIICIGQSTQSKMCMESQSNISALEGTFIMNPVKNHMAESNICMDKQATKLMDWVLVQSCWLIVRLTDPPFAVGSADGDDDGDGDDITMLISLHKPSQIFYGQSNVAWASQTACGPVKGISTASV